MKKTVLGLVLATMVMVPTLSVPSEATAPAASVSADRDRGDRGDRGDRKADRAGRKGDRADGRDRGDRRGDRGDRRKGKRYRVQPGPTFNHPFYSPNTSRYKILGAIRHTRKGQKIRTMTWSFYDGATTDALIAAHRRGVSVQFFMSRGLSTEAEAGYNYRKLKRALRVGNKGRGPGMKSWARTCNHSCRGKGGAMHFKWISFSRSGASRNVVMQGSANLNIRAAYDQWNDWYTVVNRERIYSVYQTVFSQSAKDRPQKPITLNDGNIRAWFFPRRDNIQLELLRSVRCRGAATGNGRTVIRIAAAVIRESYGEAIANRLRQLKNEGCNILLTFTIMSREVETLLGGIPKRHLVYDRNDDGLYDDYLHMKAMSIVGRTVNDRSSFITYQGSANWSNPARQSDEQGMVIRHKGTAQRYASWLTRLFNGAPTATYSRSQLRSMGVVDPYANVELD